MWSIYKTLFCFILFTHVWHLNSFVCLFVWRFVFGFFFGYRVWDKVRPSMSNGSSSRVFYYFRRQSMDRKMGPSPDFVFFLFRH